MPAANRLTNDPNDIDYVAAFSPTTARLSGKDIVGAR